MSKIAIIDYDMGNLFSVKNAFESMGVEVEITRNSECIMNADALVLPGVGAFGSAMDNLKKYGLVDIINKYIESGKPFMGICLGFQLLFEESYEFGISEGLGLVKGKVVRFPNEHKSMSIKVPQIAWNQIYESNIKWVGTEYDGIHDGEFMYFVHSYYVIPTDNDIVFSTTKYEDIEYCSAIKKDNIFAVQFHPEKSGEFGLKIYENFIKLL